MTLQSLNAVSKLEQNKGPWTVESEAIITRKSNVQEYAIAMNAGKLSEHRVKAALLCNGQVQGLSEKQVSTSYYSLQEQKFSSSYSCGARQFCLVLISFVYLR